MKYQKVVLKAHNTRYSEMSAGDKHRGPEKTFSIFYYFFSMTFPFCSFGIRFRELKCSFDGMFLCRSSCSSHFFCCCALAPASIDDDDEKSFANILTSSHLTNQFKF